jgi:hypothetical protein
MDNRLIARLVAAGRVLFGALCIGIPRIVLGPVAREASGPMVWMIRAFGIRDVVLGGGALVDLNSDEGAPQWVMAGAIADSSDIAAAVAFRDELGTRSLVATLALAVPAAALGWKSALSLRSLSRS